MSEEEKRQIGGRESEAEEDRLIKSFQTEVIEEREMKKGGEGVIQL